MEFIYTSFRHSGVILNEPGFIEEFTEIVDVISAITDENLVDKHNIYGATNIENTPKSLSKAINDLLKEGLIAKGWVAESKIFQDVNYQGDTWRLDFAKKDISIEVGFNHSSVIAWNLTKPVLASELNHVNKAIQTQIGVIITATEELKQKGGFDGAIGTYEKYLDYLPPLNNILTVPLFIIGLKAPASFIIEEFQYEPRKKIGKIVML
jgi:Restriction endonuclease BglII